MTHRVGIVGFRGYSGAELLRILARHSHVEPVLLEHRSDSERDPRSLPCTPAALQNEPISAVFLATPAGVSRELAPWLLELGVRVIDLSGAFRFRDATIYSRWYQEDHAAPELLAHAVYGLPEFCRTGIAGARLIANPGCYPTAANLALQPLIAAGVIDRQAGVVCDAKSGVSGAGRKPSLKTSFCEAADNFSAYSVLSHRHVPEILGISGLEEGELSFTAQLIPIRRGILETIYCRIPGLSGAEDVLDIYRARYRGEPFIRLYPAGQVPDLHGVQGTNFCDIGVVLDAPTGRAVVVSAIDNLGKGAAGQAIQNLNLALGFAETEGLI